MYIVYRQLAIKQQQQQQTTNDNKVQRNIHILLTQGNELKFISIPVRTGLRWEVWGANSLAQFATAACIHSVWFYCCANNVGKKKVNKVQEILLNFKLLDSDKSKGTYRNYKRILKKDKLCKKFIQTVLTSNLSFFFILFLNFNNTVLYFWTVIWTWRLRKN